MRKLRLYLAGTAYELFRVALFRVKTVNLAEVATEFVGRAKAASNYKRIQRFLRFFEMNYDQIA